MIKGIQPRNNWVPVTGDEVEVFLEAAANPQFFGRRIDRFQPTPLGDVRTAGTEPQYTLAAAALVVVDPAVTGLIADLEVVAGLFAEPEVDATLRAIAGHALDRALDVLDGVGWTRRRCASR